MDKPEWLTEDLLQRMIDEVDNHPSRIDYLADVSRGWRYYSTDEWWVPENKFTDRSLSEDTPVAVENHIKKTVDDLMSLLLKNRPVPRFHPQPGHPELSDLSDDMDALAYSTWGRVSIRHAFRSQLQEACIAGLSVSKIGWSTATKSRSTKGDIMMVNIPPAHIRFDPYASNSHRALDCRYIIHTTKQTPEYIAKRFGDLGLEAMGLKPGAEVKRSFFGKAFDNLKTNRQSRLANMTAEELMRGVNIGMGKGEDGERVDYRVDCDEYWIFPITDTESEPVGGEAINEKEYPYGVVVTRVEKRIVDIKANPYIKTVYDNEIDEYGFSKLKRKLVGHKRHPFVPLFWIRGADVNGNNSIYKVKGAVSQMIPPQISLNSVLTSIEKNAATTANPSGKYIEDAIMLPMNRLKGNPGDMIPINPMYANLGVDNVFKFDMGMPMPQYIESYAALKRNMISQLGGLNPGMIGEWPQGTSHTTYGGTAILQEVSFTPMWTPVDEFDAAIHDVTELMMGLMQQFYEPGRWVDVSSDGMERSVEITKKLISTEFNIEVTSGATTPTFDIDRDSRMANIKLQVDNALTMSLQSGNPDFLESCLISLQGLRYPPAFQYIQFLRKKLDLMKQQIEGVQAMQLAQMVQGAGQPQEGQPTEEAQPQLDYSGIEQLADVVGASPEQAIMALEARD